MVKVAVDLTKTDIQETNSEVSATFQILKLNDNDKRCQLTERYNNI